MRVSLEETIVLTATYYGKEITEPVLMMYVEDLEDLDPVLCCEAYKIYRRNPSNKFFPLPAQIREIVCPDDHITPEAKAREVAARITAAVPKFGYVNPNEAREFIGEDGWSVVERQGGWQFICENLGVSIQPGTFQAQIRDQLEGSFRYGIRAIEKSIGALPISAISDGKFLLAGASGFAPEPDAEVDGQQRKSNVANLLEKLSRKIEMEKSEKINGPEGAA